MLHIKYAPKTLSECVANLNVVKELSNYLNSQTENTVCVIFGKTGSGKTLTVNLLLQELQVHKTEINYTEKISKTFLSEKIETTQNTILVFEDAQYYENDLYMSLKKYFKTTNSLKKIIIISDIEVSKFLNTNVIYIETKITNRKLYCKFIKNIMKNENIKKPFILKYIEKYSNNIRSCITNLDSESIYSSVNHIDSNCCLQDLSTNLDIHNKIHIIHNNYMNIQYLYYENINLYDIDINTRLKFSNAMIFCDIFNTLGYNTQNWEYLKYILYVSTIQSSNILHEPPKNILKSTIWSTYSNLKSKTNKINILLTNTYFAHDYMKIKYVQYSIMKHLKDSNTDEIKKICKEYNINKSDTLNEILQIGFMKKQILKNVKILKCIDA